jgi:hypothetical protein
MRISPPGFLIALRFLPPCCAALAASSGAIARYTVDADPVVDDFVHGSFVLGEIKVGEEAKRPKGKREHRRDDFLAAVSANGSKDLQ